MATTQLRDRSLRPKSIKRVISWFDYRQRSLGMLAFILNRLTGIGLVFYLGLHLVVLSLLAKGEVAWDTFVGLMRSPVILAFDILLIAGLLIHGLNGVRVALVGMGYGVRNHKVAFVIVLVATLIVLVYAGVLVVAKTK
jgi:succinate dehydrogenase / fumarate reductase, cytochrome b subunit